MPVSSSLSTYSLSSRLEVGRSSISGRGLFTREAIAMGGPIMQLSGTIVRHAYSEDFWETGPEWVGLGFQIWLKPDAGHPIAFVNHSCEPNAIVTDDMLLIALRDIAAHEEILLDYSTTELDPFWQLHCTCKASSCRGVITSFQSLPEALQRLYMPFMSAQMLEGLRFMEAELLLPVA